MAHWAACSLLLTSLCGCSDPAAVGRADAGRQAGDGDGSSQANTGQPPVIGERIQCPDAGLDDLDAGAGPGLYEQAAEVLLQRCGQTRCHGPLPFQDLLDFSTARCDLRAAVVDVPACEYPDMPRVTPGDPANSWLMVKLTAPRDASFRILFEPEAGAQVGDDPRCEGHGFGLGMPPAGYSIDDREIDVIRRWIEAGAPGPR